MSEPALDETLLTQEAQSPFLPGTEIQYAWDSTSLGLLKTCPRLYQYTIIDGWQAKGESVHLRFGIEYHQALQEYDHARAEGVTHEDATCIVVKALLERTRDFKPDMDTKAGRYKNRRTILALVLDYLEHFANDPAQTYVLSNGIPAVELSFRFELDWAPQSEKKCVNGHDLCYQGPTDNCPYCEPAQPYILSGHLDRVVEFNNALFVMDRKTTTTTLGDYYFRQYEPHNQMTLYTIAGQIVLGAPIKGVIIDAAQVLLDQPNRFIRGWTYRTPDQLEEWLGDLRWLLMQAEGYATASYWPMNDTACDKFGGCRFREICSKSPAARERFLKANFEKLPEDERWNPLKPR